MDTNTFWSTLRICTVSVTVSLTSVLTAGTARAQDPVVVTDSPECTRCRIHAERVATLGDVDGPGAIVGQLASVARDSRGRIFVIEFGRSGGVPVFDESGSFIRFLGRSGEGPGEFRGPRHVHVGRGDTVYVLDASDRLSVFAPDLTFVRSLLIPGQPNDLAETGSGKLLLAASIRTPERIGLPLHLISPDALLVSFGADPPVFRPDRPELVARRIAPAASGGAWAAHRAQYVIERWSDSGEQLMQLVRDAEWFRPFPPSRYEPVSPDNEPHQELADIHEDENGYLWVTTYIPGENWRRGIAPRPGAVEGSGWIIEDHEQVIDTRIEVIDPSTGGLLAWRRFDELLTVFMGDGLVAAYRTDSRGVPYIDVWRLSLTQP